MHRFKTATGKIDLQTVRAACRCSPNAFSIL